MKILHTMIHVRNLEKSIAFYTEILGMKLLKKKDFPGDKFSLAVVGYEADPDNAVIELNYKWETGSYDLVNGSGHIGLGVKDIFKVCDELRAKGIVITREPGPMKDGTRNIAFIKDPDGNMIELLHLRGDEI